MRLDGMEHKKTPLKLTAMAVLSALMLSNCVTSYDGQGRQIQTVDPGAALVGAAAIGVIAYAIANDNDHRGYRGRRGRGRRY